jgi:spore maturation protein CgeB
MRILVIGRIYEEGLASLISQELRLMGHEVVAFDPGPKLIAFGSRAAFYFNRVKSLGYEAIKGARRSLGHSGLIGRLRRFIGGAGALDVTIVCHDFLAPAEAAEVKRLTRAPLVIWFPDAISNFQRHMFLNGPYDFLFFKDPYIVDILRRNLGAPAYYLPECYDPRAVQLADASETIDERYAADIGTAGNIYAYRIAFFGNLAEYRVRLWGLPPPKWMDLGKVKPMVESRFVAGVEKAKAFRSAKIVLNNLHPAEIWGTNVRTFEVCGAGAFQLVDWRPGLAQLFDLDRELVAFTDRVDLKYKINYYLAATEERQKIAAAGQARALRDHTYARRLTLLLDTVAGRARGFPQPAIRTLVEQ